MGTVVEPIGTTLEEPTGMVVEMGMTVEPTVVLDVMVVTEATEDEGAVTGLMVDWMDDAGGRLESGTREDD